MSFLVRLKARVYNLFIEEKLDRNVAKGKRIPYSVGEYVSKLNILFVKTCGLLRQYRDLIIE